MAKRHTYRLTGLVLVIILSELAFWLTLLGLYHLVSEGNPDFRLENRDYLWATAVLPLFSIMYLLYYVWKRKAIKQYADSRLLGHVTPRVSTSKYILRYVFQRWGLGFIVISLLNPQFGIKQKAGVAQGIDVVFALDISKSMEAKDLSKTHSRLDIAKRAINKLVKDDMTGRVGLLVFAGNAYKQVSLTHDYDAFRFDLGTVNTNMLKYQGTNIANAIDVALTSFNSKDKTNKAIIVVSDGENHEANAVKAANRAYKNEKVKIYTIGMGTPNGARIPNVDENGQLRGYIKDEKGNTVLSKLNEDMLKELAQKGNGVYVKATSTDLGLDYIVSDIDKIKKTKFGETEYDDFLDQFQWFLGPGIVLFLLSFLFVTDFSKRKAKRALFTE